MQTGERLKRIREFRHMTQKELGMALGYPQKSAAVRIAQYESCTVAPKEETAIAIAKILKCNYINIYDSDDLSEVERIMMNFFWLEESMGGSLTVFTLEKYSDKDDQRAVYGKYNDCQYGGVFPPVAIALNYNQINDFMREWAYYFEKRRSGEITADEYFEWKLNWREKRGAKI